MARRHGRFWLYLASATQAYKDAQYRLRIAARNYKDSQYRLLVAAQAWKNAQYRLNVAAQAWKNAQWRLNVAARGFKDAQYRLRVAAQGYKDAPWRLNVTGFVQAWKDAQYRLNVAARGYKDAQWRLNVTPPPYAICTEWAATSTLLASAVSAPSILPAARSAIPILTTSPDHFVNGAPVLRARAQSGVPIGATMAKKPPIRGKLNAESC